MSTREWESADPRNVAPDAPPYMNFGRVKMPEFDSLPDLAPKVDYEALRQQRMAEVDDETRLINQPHGPMTPELMSVPWPDPNVLDPSLEARNIEFPGPGGPLRMRFYTPKDQDGPVGLYFHTHGGGWAGFDTLENIDTENSGYATDWGCAVAHVDFRCSWEAKFPAAVEDCYVAYRYLLENADELGIDTTRIAIGGGCTGANLATVVSLMARDDGIQTPAVQWLWSPALDARNQTASYEEFANYGLTREIANTVTKLYLRTKEDVFDWRASPLLAPSLAGSPPAIIWTGEWEILRDEARSYAGRLMDAGVEVTYIEGPQQPHAGIYWLNIKTGQPTTYAAEMRPKIAELMRRYIGPDARR